MQSEVNKQRQIPADSKGSRHAIFALGEVCNTSLTHRYIRLISMANACNLQSPQTIDNRPTEIYLRRSILYAQTHVLLPILQASSSVITLWSRQCALRARGLPCTCAHLAIYELAWCRVNACRKPRIQSRAWPFIISLYCRLPRGHTLIKVTGEGGCCIAAAGMHLELSCGIF